MLLRLFHSYLTPGPNCLCLRSEELQKHGIFALASPRDEAWLPGGAWNATMSEKWRTSKAWNLCFILSYGPTISNLALKSMKQLNLKSIFPNNIDPEMRNNMECLLMSHEFHDNCFHIQESSLKPSNLDISCNNPMCCKWFCFISKVTVKGLFYGSFHFLKENHTHVRTHTHTHTHTPHRGFCLNRYFLK